MKVPTFSVVENMAYFDGDDGKRYYPFGRGAGAEVCAQHEIPSMFTLPLSPAIAQGNDTQTPVVLSRPDSEEAKVTEFWFAVVAFACQCCPANGTLLLAGRCTRIWLRARFDKS